VITAGRVARTLAGLVAKILARRGKRAVARRAAGLRLEVGEKRRSVMLHAAANAWMLEAFNAGIAPGYVYIFRRDPPGCLEGYRVDAEYVDVHSCTEVEVHQGRALHSREVWSWWVTAVSARPAREERVASAYVRDGAGEKARRSGAECSYLYRTVVPV
jgi:hypothetical protein